MQNGDVGISHISPSLQMLLSSGLFYSVAMTCHYNLTEAEYPNSFFIFFMEACSAKIQNRMLLIVKNFDIRKQT